MAASFSQPRSSTMEETAQSMTTAVADKAADLANKAGHQVDKALDSAEAAARSVADGSREASERVTEVAGNFKTAIDKSVRDQPLATLAVAGALGFVLGALWKS